MKLAKVEPGVYVVAVSGGVDSMVLLDVLRRQPDLQLIVAHFDHGIRVDSEQDKLLVQETAEKYKLPFISERAELGSNVSEAAARDARYAFLQKAVEEQGARAIITAHHQDDMLETAILNMLRGTGRKGLSSLASRKDIVRPMLACTKKEIHNYAMQHDIVWREDVTNADERYLRNYIRRNILPRFSQKDLQKLLEHVLTAHEINRQIDAVLADTQKLNELSLDRAWFVSLPYVVSCEVMASWLRKHGATEFDRPRIERIVTLAKVLQPGKKVDVDAVYIMIVGRKTIELQKRQK